MRDVVRDGGYPVSPRDEVKANLKNAIHITTAFLASPASSASATGPYGKIGDDEEGTLSSGDLVAAYKAISSGHVFVKENFLSLSLSKKLQEDIQQRVQEGRFKTSGLTNRALGENQAFDRKRDREISAIDLNSDKTSKAMELVGKVVLNVQSQLSVVLDRPSLKSNMCAHECYFSRSLPGALLPRHVDERHEEIKGSKGWSTPSRRSISWLIYLSSADVEGGELRSFPQILPVDGKVGANDGNLQVGWLTVVNGSKTVPVFLDCWRADGLAASLYYYSEGQGRRYITRDFALRDELGVLRPISSYENLVNKTQFGDFFAVEDVNRWHEGEIPAGSKLVDIAPYRGTFVAFDSVSLPHQVLPVKNGERLALAGWFHELQQEYPLQEKNA
jgi:Arc/MetJ-type ribon-helix-helix transcriptional regulator